MKLFRELVKYHVLEFSADEEYIKSELEKKIDRMAKHERYTQHLQQKQNPQNHSN